MSEKTSAWTEDERREMAWQREQDRAPSFAVLITETQRLRSPTRMCLVRGMPSFDPEDSEDACQPN